jgi:hypothetical protein
LTSQIFIIKTIEKLRKFKFLILLCGVVFAAILYFYSKNIAKTYTVTSSVFPLTSGPDKNSATSKITELLGGGSGGTKSLSEEANVNIEEVGRSKKTREAVVSEKLPEFNNKYIADLLFDEYNLHKKFYAPKLIKPTTDSALIKEGALLLKDLYSVKFNKNNLLEITYTSTNEKLVTPISYALIDKISRFYTELKVKKAQFDYDFTEKKVDSLDKVLNNYDKSIIKQNNTTLFVRPNKLEYVIPQENLQTDKIQVLTQRNGAASNREEALWRKQKVTPIIEILDKPDPPFVIGKPSKIVYIIVGFILGCILSSLLFLSGLIYRFINNLASEAIKEKLVEPKNNIAEETNVINNI